MAEKRVVMVDCRKFAERKCRNDLRAIYMAGVSLTPKEREEWLRDCIEAETKLCMEGHYDPR